MSLELVLSTFDASPSDLRRSSELADGLGIGGLWVMDHLKGTVHPGRHTVLECLASLSVVAEATEHCRIGSLVLNPVLRHPTVLAQALATIQQQSDGRLTVGIGAGGGGGGYGLELTSAGLVDHPPAVRRERAIETLEVLDHLWSGSTGPWSGDLYQLDGGDGFLTPSPRPPIILGGYGPRMARLAGDRCDGFNTGASHEDLAGMVALARQARQERAAGDDLPIDDVDAFEVSAFALFEEEFLDPSSAQRSRLEDAGVDSLFLVLHAPHDAGVIREIASAV